MRILLYKIGDRNIQIALATLTRREWEVLLLLAEGKHAAEIAEHLYVTVKSVHNNKNRIGNKLALKGYLTLNRFAKEKQLSLHCWFRILENKPVKDRLKIVISVLEKGGQ